MRVSVNVCTCVCVCVKHTASLLDLYPHYKGTAGSGLKDPLASRMLPFSQKAPEKVQSQDCAGPHVLALYIWWVLSSVTFETCVYIMRIKDAWEWSCSEHTSESSSTSSAETHEQST